MQSKTSCFKCLNGTLLRKNLTRFWPLWVLYAAIWTLAAPVYQFLTLFGVTARYVDSAAQLADRSAAALLETGTEFGLWMAVLFGCLFAMALYSYLYTARSVGMMHSFPLRRECLFLTNFLTGCVVFLTTLTVSALLTAAVQAAAGMLDWRNLGLWFLCAAGQMLFFYAFAVFCAMFTGQMLAAPAFYVAWNAVAYVLSAAVQSFAGLFLYGYEGGGTPGWVQWLTPIYQLESRLRTTSEWNEALRCSVNHDVEGLGTLGIYALAGVAFAVGALVVYKLRRSETAGDTVSIRWARQLFRFGVGLCAAMTFGQWLYQLIWDQFFYADTGLHVLTLAILCMVALGLVGFYGAEMLLCKSFRVFRSGWKGAVLTAAIVVALGVGVGLDVTGVETRVPEIGEIKELSVRIGCSNSVSATVTDPETIQKFLALHQALIDGKDEELRRKDYYRFNDAEPAGETHDSGWVDLTYDLDGTTLRRSYSLTYVYEELEKPDSLVSRAAALASDPTVQRAGLMSDWDDVTVQDLEEHLSSGQMDYVQRIYSNGEGWEGSTYPFEESVAREVLAALLRDIDAGRGGRTIFQKGGWNQVYQNDLLFRYRGEDNEERFSVQISFTPEYTETVAALKRLGIATESRPLLTQGEVHEISEAGGQLPGLEATENYSAAAEAGRVPPDVSGTVVYENPDTGEQVLMVPAEERTTREANT